MRTNGGSGRRHVPLQAGFSPYSAIYAHGYWISSGWESELTSPGNHAMHAWAILTSLAQS